jgi:hypothetical protein
MPRDINTPICNVTRLKCVNDAENDWLVNDKGSVGGTCSEKCLRPCNYVEYEYVRHIEGDYHENTKKVEEREDFKVDYPG